MIHYDSHPNHENAIDIVSIPTPFGGRSGASSGPRRAGRSIQV